MKRALTLILAVCLCLCLIAPASAAYDSSPFVGNWKIYSQEGSTPMTHEELLAMAEMGMDMANSMIVTFRDDGTMKINVFGESKLDTVAAELGVPVLTRLPIDPKVAEAYDSGLMETVNTDRMEKVLEAVEKA